MTAKNINELSFEEAMSELETIVRELEGGNSALEKSIERYERGTKLKEHCLGKLNDAKLRIEKIVKQGDQIKLEQFQAE